MHMYEFLLCVCIQIWLCVCGTSSCSCMTISLLHSCCWQRCFCCLSIGLKLTSAVWLRRRQSSNCKNSLVVADVVLLLLLRLLLFFLCMVGIIYFFHRKMYVKYKTGKQRIQTRTFTHTHEHRLCCCFIWKPSFITHISDGGGDGDVMIFRRAKAPSKRPTRLKISKQFGDLKQFPKFWKIPRWSR